MEVIKLWILRALDGFITLMGELIMFLGVYTGYDTIKIIAIGLFLVIIGQLAGANAIRYEDRKRLQLLLLDPIENMGRQFAYPALLFIIYLIYGNRSFLSLAFVLALAAFVKSAFILYKVKIAEMRL